MADVASSLADWSTTASSNLPNRNTAIGTGLADNLQQIQATVRAGLAFKGDDIASGSTVDLSTATGNRIDVTHTSGTTAISSLGTASAGIWKVVKFVVSAGTLTLTHNATSLILPGGANITVANGDIAYFTSLGSGNWECNFYQRANGSPVALENESVTAAKIADDDATISRILDMAGVGVGGYSCVQLDLTGATEPPSTHFIRLKSGLTGVGAYNNGKLTAESVTGSAPLIIATAVISDADSPMNGQTVHLIEDERRVLRAGEPGLLQDDQMQRITGRFGRAYGAFTVEAASGAFSDEATKPGGRGSTATNDASPISFDSGNSPGARVGDETRARNIGVAVYMRIK